MKKGNFKIFENPCHECLDLLVKLFPLIGLLLQVATWICIKSLLYSALLMATSSPAHLFAILFKLLWGRSCFIAEVSATLNLT